MKWYIDIPINIPEETAIEEHIINGPDKDCIKCQGEGFTRDYGGSWLDDCDCSEVMEQMDKVGDKMNKEDFKAKDLKDLRLIKGLSQGQMAKYLCCCHTGISIVERGESPITRNMIQNLPDVYALPDNPRVKRDAKCISIFDVRRTGLDRINAMKIKLNCRTNGEVLHKLLDMAEGVESEK